MGHQSATIGNARGSFLRILAVVLLPALVYANTLRNHFHYDDTHFILNNLYTHNISGISHFFVSSRLISNIPLSGYRPLTMATFALNYVTGGQNPAGYHLINVVIHALNSLILYAVALVVMTPFKTPRRREAALSVALLFACHPINTQPVNYISGRSTLLAGGFSLLCILLYARGCEAAGRKKALFLTGSLAAYLCALLSKEEAVAVPGLLALYEICRLRLPIGKQRLRRIALEFLPFVILTAAFMLLVIRVLGVMGETQQARGLGENVLTQARALFIYMRLIVLPTGLSIDHVVAASRSIMEPATLAAVFAGIAILAGSLFMIRSLPIVTFGVWWFVFALAPSSTLVALKLVVNEQRMYLPAVGVMLIAGTAFGAALERASAAGRKWRRNALICGLAAILLILSALTVRRNTEWRDPQSLWASALKKYPNSARANTQMAYIYLEMDKLDKALETSLRAVKEAPHTPEARIALANAYSRSGRQEEALVEARAAVALNAASPEAQTILGLVYARLGRYGEAEAAWKRALELDPQNAEARENIYKLRARVGEREQEPTE